MKAQLASLASNVIVVVTLVAIFALIASAYFKVEVSESKVRELSMNMDRAHLVRSCMESDGHIDIEFLRKNKDKGFSTMDIDKRCSTMEGSAMVRNLETGEKWEFNFEDAGTRFDIFVSIKDKDKIYSGEIVVTGYQSNWYI